MKNILLIAAVLFIVSCCKTPYVDNKPLTGFRNGVYYEYTHSPNRVEPISFSNINGDTITTIVDTVWLKSIPKNKPVSWTVNVPIFGSHANYYDSTGRATQDSLLRELIKP